MRAVVQGVHLAKASAATVLIVNAFTPLHSLGAREDMFAGQPEAIRKAAIALVYSQSQDALDRAAAVARDCGVACQMKQVDAEQPYKAILALAKSEGCDLIVMASHGRSGIAALVLGSETTKVLTHSDIPVLVCR
jgi:nucleotide-binding universal stress UspA family protein